VVLRYWLGAYSGSAYSGDYNELIYLRARFYAPNNGRFLTKDTWEGTSNKPLSFNQWNYAESNPITTTDPSGHCIIDERSGGCLPYDPQLPNTEGYDEKNPPAGIFWVSNTLA
jgi:RHS repeat-associated protein